MTTSARHVERQVTVALIKFTSMVMVSRGTKCEVLGRAADKAAAAVVLLLHRPQTPDDGFSPVSGTIRHIF